MIALDVAFVDVRSQLNLEFAIVEQLRTITERLELDLRHKSQPRY